MKAHIYMIKIFIGLVIPYVGVIVSLPWISSIDASVFGIPFVYAWIFAWFFITSGCLYVCWKLFDQNSENEEIQQKTQKLGSL
jgi:Protein of unknown function (DUF3311)